MIVLAPELQARLDKAWTKLQYAIQKREGSISQIDLDTACVNEIEQFVMQREVDIDNQRIMNKLLNS